MMQEINTGCKVERCGEVANQLNIAEKLGSGLYDAIQRLSAKIDSVVRNEPTCGSDTAKAPCCTASLAEAMRCNNMVTEAAIEKINSLVDRCEL